MKELLKATQTRIKTALKNGDIRDYFKLIDTMIKLHRNKRYSEMSIDEATNYYNFCSYEVDNVKKLLENNNLNNNEFRALTDILIKLKNEIEDMLAYSIL